MQPEWSVDRDGVWVDQQFRWVEPVSLAGQEGTVRPQPVPHTLSDAGDMTMKDVAGTFRKTDPHRLANTQNSTAVAWAENTATFTPLPSNVTPSGSGVPSDRRPSDMYAIRPRAPPLGRDKAWRNGVLAGARIHPLTCRSTAAAARYRARDKALLSSVSPSLASRP
jgi:hypothetical protein